MAVELGRGYCSIKLKTLLWWLLDSVSGQCSSDSIENKGVNVVRSKISGASEAFGAD